MKFTPNENVLRIALIVFSVLFGILSISLIALGAVYMDELYWPRRYVGLDFLELPTMLIVLGSISFFLSIMGCFCAKTYNTKLLLIFAVILLLVLCLELSIAIIAFINFDEYGGTQTKTHQLMAKQYKLNASDEIIFQEIEDHYNCCGVLGSEEDCVGDVDTDEEESTGTEASSDYTYSTAFKTTGCAQAVNDHIRTTATEIGYFCSILAILQIFQIIYVSLLKQSMGKYF